MCPDVLVVLIPGVWGAGGQADSPLIAQGCACAIPMKGSRNQGLHIKESIL